MQSLRYFIISLTLICMSMLYANTVLFNFTVICMEPHDVSGMSSNETHRFSPVEEGWILSMVSVGGVLGTYPAIYITNIIGLRLSFTIFGITSGIATALMPVAANTFYGILAVRFIQGFGMACAYLASGAVPIAWGGAKSQGLFVSVLTVSYQLGPFMAMLNSGYFCTSPYGWQSVYYLYGGATVCIFVIFLAMYSNSPHKNRLVAKSKISALPDAHSLPTKKQVIPYKEMATCRSVFGILSTGFGDSVGYEVFLLYGPIYVNTVLQLEIHQTGLLAALPYLISMASKFLAGIFLDRARCVGAHFRCISFTAFFQLAMAFSFIALTLISADMTFIPGALFTLSMVVSGVHHVGLMNASQIVAQQYTHILSSVLAAQNSLVGLLLPPIVSMFVPHYSGAEWSMVFYGIVGILILTNILFVSLTKVQPAQWTRPQQSKDEVSSTNSNGNLYGA
uniref:MFS domain-containing protein n=1 Tax=Steinernema glaseri TaxID=37863 RepID=A0A1I8AHQ7_9BILA